jgi:hypothetical protein
MVITMRILLKTIRRKCIDCSGGSTTEVRLCPCKTCALWPFRMGVNPSAKPRGRSYKANGSSEKPPQFAAISDGEEPSNGDLPSA